MKNWMSALVIVLILSCSKDNSKSDQTKILLFSASSPEQFPIEQIIINENFNHIELLSGSEVTSENFPIVLTPQIEVSPGASIAPESGSSISFNGFEGMNTYTIVAENGENIEEWYVSMRDRQIPNSDFEFWHEKEGLNGQPFNDPGKHEETTVWATANMGTSIYSTYGTQPVTEGDNTVVQITTGSTSAVPITAGTLFLGKFDINGAINNPTDPKQATNFGIPFAQRPVSISFDYSFIPGDELIKATLKDPGNLFGGFTIEQLEGTDEFNIYAELEKVVSDTRILTGRAELRSNVTQPELLRVTIPIEYYTDDTPTQLTIVFASSANGDLYQGAVGTTLTIDNLRLNYE